MCISQSHVYSAVLDSQNKDNHKCWRLRHRKFTRLPHLAGTEQNLVYAEEIKEEWLQFGLDSVEMVPYDVLLSYPNKSQPNYISIVDQLGNEVNVRTKHKTEDFKMCTKTPKMDRTIQYKRLHRPQQKH